MLEQNRKLTDVGDVKIHNSAIKSITELTVSKIKGVVKINKSPFKKALKNIGMGNFLDLNDGIKIEQTKSGTKIILYIITAYGMDIAEIAAKVQDDVKQAVENMAGISLAEVDVNVVEVEQA